MQTVLITMNAMQTDLVYPADIEITPEKAVADYLISKRLESELVKKPPDWDLAGDTPEINLVAAERDVAEAKGILTTEKTAFNAGTKEIEDKWTDLRDKQNELRHTFIKNNKVLKRNFKERLKSEKQIIEEKVEQERIKEEIDDLEEKLRNFQAAEVKITKKIEELKIYEDFLQKVVDEYPEFNGIDDILNRYECLMKTRKEMKQLQTSSVNKVEKIREEVEKFTEGSIKEMFELNRSLHELRMKEYFIQKELSHWGSAIEKIRDMGRKDYDEISQSIEGIWQLYLNVCAARKQTPKLDKSSLKEQLIYIVDNVNFLHKVVIESKGYLRKTGKGKKRRAIPSERELDKWSTDYNMFKSICSNKAQASKK